MRAYRPTSGANAPALTRALLSRASDPGLAPPDLVVAELGDGLLGTYGVDAILECADLRGAFTAVVLAANDPVAAWGGVTLLEREYGIRAPCPPRSLPIACSLRA